MSQLLKDVIAECRAGEQADMVNHPPHYQRGGVECIDMIRATVQDLTGLEAFYAGTVLKYLFRWKNRNGVEDLRKAEWYLRELIEYAASERNEEGEHVRPTQEEAPDATESRWSMQRTAVPAAGNVHGGRQGQADGPAALPGMLRATGRA